MKQLKLSILLHDFSDCRWPGQVGTCGIDDRLSETTCNGIVNSAKPSRLADFADCSNTLRACSSNVSSKLTCYRAVRAF